MGKRTIIIAIFCLATCFISSCASQKKAAINITTNQNDLERLRVEIEHKMDDYNKRIDSINKKLNLSIQSAKVENRKIVTYEPTLPVNPETGLPPVKSIEESYSTEISELKALLASVEKRFSIQLQSVRDSISLLRQDSSYLENKITEELETKRPPNITFILGAILALLFCLIVVYRYLKHK